MTSIIASVNKLAGGACGRQGEVNQKCNDGINFCRFAQAPEMGRGNRQTEQQQPWHMAHIHSRLPRHCAPQRKSPFCFPKQGGRKVSGVNRRSAPLLHPPSKEKREKEKGTGLPNSAWRPPYLLAASAHKHRLISSTTTTVVIVFSCNLIGSVCIVALKTSPTMTLLSCALLLLMKEVFQLLYLTKSNIASV